MPKYKRQSGSKARKKCTLYDLRGKKIKTYDSKRDLMEDLYHERNNRITQLLVKCITRGGVLQNKYLVAEGDAEKYDFTLHLQREKTRIIVEYDQEGNEINRFATLAEAQRYYGISVATCKTDTETIYT